MGKNGGDWEGDGDQARLKLAVAMLIAFVIIGLIAWTIWG